ncbi:MAG: Transcriptional regulator, MerR family [Pseudomonadota bacterium]|jgi:DNA-binding transcriptional MerR regulator
MAEISLPTIPSKRYFTIGEVSELCNVKPHVLRYWEQEFSQLRPVKRRGNRRYYQHHEVMLIRRIRELLYEEGFTINGARSRLTELNRVTSLDSLSAITPLGAMADARAANFTSTKSLPAAKDQAHSEIVEASADVASTTITPTLRIELEQVLRALKG